MNYTATATNGMDMLAIFDDIRINNEEKISARDKAFCENQQKLLDISLDRIDKWYTFFHREAEHYKDSHRIAFQPDGSVKTNPPYTPHGDYPAGYQEYEFLPFDLLNQLVNQRRNAIIRFGRTIISYFNRTYALSVNYEEPGKETLPVTLRPGYLSYIDQVIDHLGGRNFRETAEEEIISRFHKNVLGPYKKMPELKNGKIIFYDATRFDEFYIKNCQQYHVSYSYENGLESLCEGIAWAGNDSLNGNSNMILAFDSHSVDITQPYSIHAGEAEKMKFYKNGRIDVLFSSQAAAETAYKKLRLHKINYPNN